MNLLLGVTGSVAAKLTPKLVDKLNIRNIILTEKSKYFIDDNFINEYEHLIYQDKDEWSNDKYYKNDPVLHINLANENDVLLICPISANTISKIANGICDNLLTCVVYAWGNKPLIIAPAMNTNMWYNKINLDNIDKIQNNYRCLVIHPVSKMLACGQEGMGALADLDKIVKITNNIGHLI